MNGQRKKFGQPDIVTKGRAGHSICVASSLDDLLQVVAIRSQVYLAEQSCPWTEEFDRNDFCATHLVLRVDHEPVGTLRIRYFAEFAKLERLAVLLPFRRRGCAADLVHAAHYLAAMKGFGAAYIHAQDTATEFWLEQGYAIAGERSPFMFSGFSYAEMTCDIGARSSLGLHSPPMTLNRPEGAWDIPGPMEGGAGGMGFAAND